MMVALTNSCGALTKVSPFTTLRSPTSPLTPSKHPMSAPPSHNFLLT